MKAPTPKDPWPDVDIDDEDFRVEIWRQEELERAGIPRATAYRLAPRMDVDLRQAIGMFRSGCSPDLLEKILV